MRIQQLLFATQKMKILIKPKLAYQKKSQFKPFRIVEKVALFQDQRPSRLNTEPMLVQQIHSPHWFIHRGQRANLKELC